MMKELFLAPGIMLVGTQGSSYTTQTLPSVNSWSNTSEVWELRLECFADFEKHLPDKVKQRGS